MPNPCPGSASCSRVPDPGYEPHVFREIGPLARRGGRSLDLHVGQGNRRELTLETDRDLSGEPADLEVLVDTGLDGGGDCILVARRHVEAEFRGDAGREIDLWRDAELELEEEPEAEEQ